MNTGPAGRSITGRDTELQKEHRTCEADLAVERKHNRHSKFISGCGVVLIESACTSEKKKKTVWVICV